MLIELMAENRRALDRRTFLKGVAAVAGLEASGATGSAKNRDPVHASLDGHTLTGSFHFNSADWSVYEDLRTHEGVLTFVSSKGPRRTLTKSAEATFAEANPPYLGLSLKDIGLSGPDLLANKLLENGDPDPEAVKAAAPPLESANFSPRPGFRPRWNTFVGTKECSDTMPVFPVGNTRTYHPGQYFPELTQALAEKRFEGLLGGWMPAVRKVMPVSESAYYELLIFGDVEAHDRFIVQTWHRTAYIENGRIAKVVYGHSYPAYPPGREDPQPAEFYRALLVFAEYWDRQLQDMAPASVPENVWIDMSKHAFAKELIVRPDGVYPKYGAVDRDYYGSEYDGFQDTFTMAVYANLEWGRFEQARLIVDNYFTDFVDSKGMINMRGPETAQFGLTLSLLARYFNYTGDSALLTKHRPKIESTAALLLAMHDESLKLPQDDPGYGLIHGWSESDSCLAPKPLTWWLPYFANSAFAARGLKDIAQIWPAINHSGRQQAGEWMRRSATLRKTTVASLRKNVRTDMHPPYVGPFPGTTLTFRESLQTEHPSPQQWPHRPYSELLEADMLPPDLANLVIDCMRAYGATTLGVVANVSRPHPTGREILGFISYGYAQALLRLGRVEEYLLFLYAHRFHDHNRGSWTAGEVAGITGDGALFCIPAQQTIPLLVRWMLVLEDADEDRLYLARGVPREWIGSGREIRIEKAPTRWGTVDFALTANLQNNTVNARVQLARAAGPKELHLQIRLPRANALQNVVVNGRPVPPGEARETVVIPTNGETQFHVSAKFG